MSYYYNECSKYFYTVFPNDPHEMPQDFGMRAEAEEYGDEMFGRGNYVIEYHG